MYLLSGRKFLLSLLTIISVLVVLRGMSDRLTSGTSLFSERFVTIHLNMLLSERAQSIIQDNTDILVPHYDFDSIYGRWAFEHETRRSSYLRAWSEARNIDLVDTEVEIEVYSVEPKENVLWVELGESMKISYRHRTRPESDPDWFGIGAEHFLELVMKERTWAIRKDWYLDPLDVDFETCVSCFPDIPVQASGGNGDGKHMYTYNRENAVAYADKYCGLAWGCGNTRKYNPKYKDFTGLGGDCTNFISQVLGDEEAGGLPMTYAWRYLPHGPGTGATQAWAQASGLLNYMLGSGRAICIARGTYTHLVTPDEMYLQGAIGELNKGDLIAYEKKGRICHFAVVVGSDSGSYLLVNSHTADRYHVPWDLGWDQNTVFWLLKIVG